MFMSSFKDRDDSISFGFVYEIVELNDWLYLVHKEHIYGQVARTTGYNQHLSSNRDCEQNGESSFGHTTFSQYLPVNVE